MPADPVRHGVGRRVRHAPWTAEQAARLVVANLAALAGIVATAYGAASSDDVQTAVLWCNLAVAALAFAGVSNGLWLVRCHSTTSTWRADVLDEVVATVRVPRPVITDGHEGYVVVPGLARYHRPDCAFVEGRPARPADDDLHRGDLVPCEVCVR